LTASELAHASTRPPARQLRRVAKTDPEHMDGCQAHTEHSPYEMDGYYLAMELMENRCASQVRRLSPFSSPLREEIWFRTAGAQALLAEMA
jgi:hypothetical protein